MPVPERINWMGLTTKLGEDIQSAVETRSRERAAFDEEARTTEEKITKYEGGQDQKFSELVFNGVDKGRDLIYDWTNKAKRGEITRAELKLRMNNLSEGLTGFAKSATDFDARMVEILERQNSGKAGKLEAYKNQRFAEMASLRNSEYYTDPKTGKGFMIKYNDEGEIISKQDANRVNNPGNMLGLKIDVSEEIKGIVDTWKDVSIETPGYRGSSTTETSKKLHEEFMKSKLAVMQSVLANENAIFSVLADNSADNYEPYTTESEKEQLLDQRVAAGEKLAEMSGDDFNASEYRASQEKLLVKLEEDGTGVLQPVLTPEQLKAAEATVSDAIDMQVGYKKSTVAPRAPSRSGGGGGNGSSKDPKNPYKYEAISQAWNMANPDMTEDEAWKATLAMTAEALPGYRIAYNTKKDRWNVYDTDPNVENKFITSVRDMDQLAKFTYNPGTNKTATQLMQEEGAVYNGNDSTDPLGLGI